MEFKFKRIDMKILKNDWTAIVLGLAIMGAMFVVSPRESLQNVIGGIGIVTWTAYWLFRKRR